MRELSSKEFDHWINQMCFDCKKGTGIYPSMLDYLSHYPIKRNDNYNIHVVNHDTIVRSQWVMTKYITDFRLTNYISGKTGWARMSDYDEWSNRYALGIAWARYCGYEIPKIKDYLTESDFENLKSGTILKTDDSNEKITFIGLDPICSNFFLAYTTFPLKDGIPVVGQFKIAQDTYFIDNEVKMK